MKLYIIILKAKNKSIMVEKNRGLWISFEKNYSSAREKALQLYNELEPIFYGEMSFSELIYLLPFFNRKQK